MARAGITQTEIAEFLGMSFNNFNLKMNGKVGLSLSEVIAIKDAFFPDETIDYLFTNTDERLSERVVKR